MRSVRTFSALAMSLMALTMADVAPRAQRASLATAAVAREQHVACAVVERDVEASEDRGRPAHVFFSAIMPLNMNTIISMRSGLS